MLGPGGAVVVAGGRMMRMLGPGWSGRLGRGAGGLEVVALLSFLACWGLGAGAPLFHLARFGGTGGGGARGAWGWKKECVGCWPGSRSGGFSGVCTVAFPRLRVRSASLRTVSLGVCGPWQCVRALVERVVKVVVPCGLGPYDPSLRRFQCVWTAGGSLSPVECCVEGFPRGAFAACEGGGLEELLPA